MATKILDTCAYLSTSVFISLYLYTSYFTNLCERHSEKRIRDRILRIANNKIKCNVKWKIIRI